LLHLQSVNPAHAVTAGEYGDSGSVFPSANDTSHVLPNISTVSQRA
jgi:hypothetical protein